MRRIVAWRRRKQAETKHDRADLLLKALVNVDAQRLTGVPGVTSLSTSTSSVFVLGSWCRVAVMISRQCDEYQDERNDEKATGYEARCAPSVNGGKISQQPEQ